MKKILFTSTALAAMAFGGVASAQGISLFGDARLGLGYNIFNNGNLNLNDDGETDDDIRAVSRVRFGVNMTGTTDSGITFGATIRADNSAGRPGRCFRPEGR
jgi:outer membrane protein OmpU